MQFCKRASQGEANSKALGIRRGFSAELYEGLEYVFSPLRWNLGTIISYRNRYLTVYLINVDVDIRFCVFYSIMKKVVENLVEG